MHREFTAIAVGLALGGCTLGLDDKRYEAEDPSATDGQGGSSSSTVTTTSASSSSSSASAATSATSGGGSMTECTPGASQACYSGAASTKNAGKCKEGTRHCNSAGKWGSCQGEILPAAEPCGSKLDENCDGKAQACPADASWSASFGGASWDYFTDVAADPTGSVFVAGSSAAGIDLGGPCNLSSPGRFVAKLDSKGVCLWARAMALDSIRLAIDSKGNVVVTGSFQGPVDLGTGPITPAGSRDVAVVKISTSNTTQWVKTFGDADDQYPYDIAVGPKDGIAIAGTFTTKNTTAGFVTPPLAAAGYYDAWVAMLDATGALVWAQSVGSAWIDYGRAIAVDEKGWTYLGVMLGQSAALGGKQLDIKGQDVVLVAFDDKGSLAWSTPFVGGIQLDDPTSISARNGKVALTAAVSESITVGSKDLKTLGGNDILVAKLDAANGAVSWAALRGGAGSEYPYAVQLDASGNVLVAGSFSFPVDMVDPKTLVSPMIPLGSQDALLFRAASADGAIQWARRFGGFADEHIAAMAELNGKLVLVGSYADTIDFGLGKHTSVGKRDTFITLVTP